MLYLTQLMKNLYLHSTNQDIAVCFRRFGKNANTCVGLII